MEWQEKTSMHLDVGDMWSIEGNYQAMGGGISRPWTIVGQIKGVVMRGRCVASTGITLMSALVDEGGMM